MNGPLLICPTGAVALHSGRSGIEMSAKGALTREEVMIWLESSCAAQGVPLLVVDRATLRQVGVLLGMGTEGLDGADAVSTSSAQAERVRRPAFRAHDDRAS